MTDGLLREPRIGEPETNVTPPALGPAIRFVVNPQGFPDTSISGPVMLQQPPRWTHDFDPLSGDTRAHLPSVVPIFANPPAAATPPPGTSDSTLATTEFVSDAMAQAVIEAVAKARIGTTDGFNAAPGEIGEFLFVTNPPPGSEILTGSLWPMLTLEIPAGDWDVSAQTGFAFSGLNPPGLYYLMAISETTNFPGFPNGGGGASTTVIPVNDTVMTCFQRVLTAQPKTLFLLAYSVFPAGRMYAWGFMSARRRR
jgi:hypothetical protein